MICWVETNVSVLILMLVFMAKLSSESWASVWQDASDKYLKYMT